MSSFRADRPFSVNVLTEKRNSASDALFEACVLYSTYPRQRVRYFSKARCQDRCSLFPYCFNTSCIAVKRRACCPGESFSLSPSRVRSFWSLRTKVCKRSTDPPTPWRALLRRRINSRHIGCELTVYSAVRLAPTERLEGYALEKRGAASKCLKLSPCRAQYLVVEILNSLPRRAR